MAAQYDVNLEKCALLKCLCGERKRVCCYAAMKPPGLLQGKLIFKKLPNGNCKQFITTSYVGLQFKIHV